MMKKMNPNLKPHSIIEHDDDIVDMIVEMQKRKSHRYIPNKSKVKGKG
jgi:hypothetical protein